MPPPSFPLASDGEIRWFALFTPWGVIHLNGEKKMLPKLDYYYGREVIEVGTTPDWSITLDGDVVIQNTDINNDAPPDMESLVGLKLLMAILNDVSTILRFGQQTSAGPQFTNDVALTPLEYTIYDPNSQQPEDEPFYPQRYVIPTPGSDAPPDPSPERVVEQSDEHQQAIQEASQSPQEATEVKTQPKTTPKRRKA